MKIIDISPVLSSRTAVFPGDVPFRRKIALDFKSGDHLLLSAIETTLHLGAHTDAPNHYDANGVGIESADLSVYIGACSVFHAKAPRGVRIERKHLSTAGSWPTERILVRTESFPDPDQWNSDFNSFHPDLIEEWAKEGVKLIGIDTPSIDPETSKTLDAHKMGARHGLAILEGIVLDHVPEGQYTLIALPLKIEGGDASPVRAVLIDSDLSDRPRK